MIRCMREIGSVCSLNNQCIRMLCRVSESKQHKHVHFMAKHVYCYLQIQQQKEYWWSVDRRVLQCIRAAAQLSEHPQKHHDNDSIKHGDSRTWWALCFEFKTDSSSKKLTGPSWTRWLRELVWGDQCRDGRSRIGTRVVLTTAFDCRERFGDRWRVDGTVTKLVAVSYHRYLTVISTLITSVGLIYSENLTGARSSLQFEIEIATGIQTDFNWWYL